MSYHNHDYSEKGSKPPQKPTPTKHTEKATFNPEKFPNMSETLFREVESEAREYFNKLKLLYFVEDINEVKKDIEERVFAYVKGYDSCIGRIKKTIN